AGAGPAGLAGPSHARRRQDRLRPSAGRHHRAVAATEPRTSLRQGGRGPPVRRPPVRRLVALFAFLLFALAGIVLRLAVLQVRDASAYEHMAMSQRLRTIPLPARRGEILDQGRQPLAMTLDAKDVFADPEMVRDPAGTAAILAGVLDVSARTLQAL